MPNWSRNLRIALLLVFTALWWTLALLDFGLHAAWSSSRIGQDCLRFFLPLIFAPVVLGRDRKVQPTGHVGISHPGSGYSISWRAGIVGAVAAIVIVLLTARLGPVWIGLIGLLAVGLAVFWRASQHRGKHTSEGEKK